MISTVTKISRSLKVLTLFITQKNTSSRSIFFREGKLYSMSWAVSTAIEQARMKARIGTPKGQRCAAQVRVIWTFVSQVRTPRVRAVWVTLMENWEAKTNTSRKKKLHESRIRDLLPTLVPKIMESKLDWVRSPFHLAESGGVASFRRCKRIQVKSILALRITKSVFLNNWAGLI